MSFLSRASKLCHPCLTDIFAVSTMAKASDKSNKGKPNSKDITTTESEKEPPKKKICLVMYKTGDMEEFEDEDQARVSRSSLPPGMVSEYKLFDNMDDLNMFRNKQGAACGATAFAQKIRLSAGVVVTPEKRTAVPMKGVSALSGISFPKSPFAGIGKSLPMVFEGKQKGFLESVQKNSLINEAIVDIDVFKFDGIPKPEFIVVSFDLISPKSNDTYWLHRPDKWVQIFDTARVQKYTEIGDPVCFDYKLFTARNTHSLGDNNAPLKKKIIKKDKSVYELEI